MSFSNAANGRHVVRIETEHLQGIDGTGLVLGQTRYYGLYFQDGEVATCWAVEAFERHPGGGSQKGFTVNRYADGSTTVMAFEGFKSTLDEAARNHFRGSWQFVSGSGRYHGITGGGEYEGESFEGIAYSNVSGNVAGG
jgi:hypothetical protein